jgi:hypothetical protein
MSREPNMTSSTRTARGEYPCAARKAEECTRRIVPGQLYVRVVLFPGHDACGRDRPSVDRLCGACADYYGLTEAVR